MRLINKGENVLIRRNLQKADGSNLLLSEVSSIVAAITQDGYVIDTLSYPSTYLRQGDSTSQLELEITTATSDRFKPGKVIVKYTIIFANPEFEGEGIQKDIIVEHTLNVK